MEWVITMAWRAQPTARDRDRLRQQHLEALGWRFHRIWSTDWFLRPDVELERALRAYEEAVAFADKVDSGHALVPQPAAVANPPPDTTPAGPKPAAAVGPRPPIKRGLSIHAYSDVDLQRIASWLRGREPWATDAELLPLIMEDLGFRRRGSKIVGRMEAAIRHARVLESRPGGRYPTEGPPS